MSYKLYQIKLTDEEVNLINSTGDFGAVPKQKMKLDMSHSEDAGGIASRAYGQGYYEHVANIKANDLEGVFEVGNVGPEEDIERLGSMHSVSVGDLVIDPAGNKHVVASCGFQEVF
jgi:hypothetical protein|tara:strand:+ start:206 stop:553 length:348 start_codon:yes stop_codon:yes gene_type:complete